MSQDEVKKAFINYLLKQLQNDQVHLRSSPTLKNNIKKKSQKNQFENLNKEKILTNTTQKTKKMSKQNNKKKQKEDENQLCFAFDDVE